MIMVSCESKYVFCGKCGKGGIHVLVLWLLLRLVLGGSSGMEGD